MSPAAPAFSPASRARLTRYDHGRFAGRTLFERIGRVVCDAGCLPRKELYEAWEVARRVRRWCRGGRVLDVGGGHGLLAQMLLILDATSSSAVVLDPAIPPSAAAVHAALVAEWPTLASRVTFQQSALDATELGGAAELDLQPDDLVVSCHACGAFADRVMDVAIAAGTRLALLPCCHDRETCDTGALDGWMDVALAIDATRVARLRTAGYHVRTQRIPAAITPKNRLLVAVPAPAPAMRR